MPLWSWDQVGRSHTNFFPAYPGLDSCYARARRGRLYFRKVSVSMFARRRSLEELTAELDAILAKIAAHPFQSPLVVAASEVLGAHDGEARVAIDRALAEQPLPSLTELGKMTVRSMYSLVRLQYKRYKLVEAIARLKRQQGIPPEEEAPGNDGSTSVSAEGILPEDETP